MARFLPLLCLSALACGRIDRPIGSYAPELGQAGQDSSGEAGAGPDTGSGSPLDLDRPWKSSGCGHALPEQQVPTVVGSRRGYTEWNLTQPGLSLDSSQAARPTARQFFVRVPADYDPNRPYRVVYLLRGGCDASDTYLNVTYDLFDEAKGGDEQAVYVDLAVPDHTSNPHCYDTTTGLQSLEYEAFEQIHGLVESRYCVDNNRIFAVGYSQGSGLSNMWGCYFAGIPQPPRQFAPKWAMRGHAAVAGWREPNQPVPCNGPAAGIWIHDIDDLSQGLYDSNTSALMLGMQANGCTGFYDDGPKEAWARVEDVPGLEGGACQLYTACSAQSLAQHPLVYCNAAGSGGTDRAEIAVPAFTAFFASMDPKP
jgi:poly(3-hydroxybutyrate) depolymerase